MFRQVCPNCVQHRVNCGVELTQIGANLGENRQNWANIGQHRPKSGEYSGRVRPNLATLAHERQMSGMSPEAGRNDDKSETMTSYGPYLFRQCPTYRHSDMLVIPGFGEIRKGNRKHRCVGARKPGSTTERSVSSRHAGGTNTAQIHAGRPHFATTWGRGVHPRSMFRNNPAPESRTGHAHALWSSSSHTGSWSLGQPDDSLSPLRGTEG